MPCSPPLEAQFGRVVPIQPGDRVLVPPTAVAAFVVRHDVHDPTTRTDLRLVWCGPLTLHARRESLRLQPLALVCPAVIRSTVEPFRVIGRNKVHDGTAFGSVADAHPPAPSSALQAD